MSLKFFPVGGCGEFGMNLMLVAHADTVIAIDAGLMFADDRLLGISGIVPDLRDFPKPFDHIDSYIITHGHEDHIGALPFLIQSHPAPIYATAWTRKLIQRKFEDYGCGDNAEAPIIEVVAGEKITIDDFEIEYLHTHHSIPDACNLLVKAGQTRFFHTGDFRFEEDPACGTPVDFKRLGEIGAEGVDIVFADSTNAEVSEITTTEKDVKEALQKQFESAPGRVFVATFASNFWRIRSVIEACADLGKRLCVAGNGYRKTLEIANELGRLDIPEGVLVDVPSLKTVEDSDLVVLITGSQGEWRSALPSFAKGEHPNFKIKAEDTILFSSRIIPGNEKSVSWMKSLFEKHGARVITGKSHPEIHVSGHADREDIERLLELLNPKLFIPVHGTFSQMTANQSVYENRDQTALIENGTGFVYDGTKISPIEGIPPEVATAKLFIEDESRTLISRPILRQRLKIGTSGLALVVGVYDSKKKSWLVRPTIELFGCALESKESKLSDLASSLEPILSQELAGLSSDAKTFLSSAAEFTRLQTRRALVPLLGRKVEVIARILPV